MRDFSAIVYDFESLHQRGAVAEADKFLGQLDSQAQRHVIRELVMIDLEYQGKLSSPSDPRRHLAKFPFLWEDEEVLRAILAFKVAQSDRSTHKSSPTKDGDVAEQGKMNQGVPFALSARGEDEASLPKIEGFRIIGTLGRGGMSTVYLAEQAELDRLVALKVVQSGGALSNEFLDRLEQEARLIASIKHPNIVSVHGMGRTGAFRWISLELCEEGSLATRLRGKLLKPRVAALLVECLSRAVGAAHDKKVIHRDLKPSNVLLAPGDERTSPFADGPLKGLIAKVSDFGLAKEIDEPTRTLSGAIVGTPAYMSPEQAFGELSQVDGRADVYSLGAMLYEFLTGRPPFLGATTVETLMLVRSAEPTPPRQLQPTTPVDLETICLKCLHKDKHSRYATAVELAEDLHRYLTDQSILARRAGVIERGRKWCKRHPTTAMIGVVTMTAASIITVGSLVYQQKLSKARDRSLRAAQAMVSDVAEVVAPIAGTQSSKVSEILERSKEIFDDLDAEYSDFATRSGRGKMLNALAGAYLELQEVDEAVALAESSTKLYLPLVDEASCTFEDQLEFIKAFRLLGTARFRLGQIAGASQAFSQGRKMTMHLATRANMTDVLFTEIVSMHIDHSRVAYMQGDIESAMRHAAAALDIAKEEIDKFPAKQVRRTHAMALEWAGEMHYERNELKEALNDYQAAERILRELIQTDESAVPTKLSLSRVLQSMSSTYHYMEDADKANATAEEAMGIVEALSKNNPSNFRWMLELFRAKSQLASLRIDAPDKETQQQSIEASREIELSLMQVLRKYPDDVEIIQRLAATRMRIALERAKLVMEGSDVDQNRRETIRLVQQIQDAQEKLLQIDKSNARMKYNVGSAGGTLGYCLMQVGEKGEAKKSFEKALALFDQIEKNCVNPPAYWLESTAMIQQQLERCTSTNEE